MKKIVFIDLQENEFYLRTMNQILYKRSSATKHKFYLEYLLESERYDVYNYSTKERHGDLLSKLGVKSKSELSVKVELNYLLRRNGIKNSIKQISDLSMLTSDDIIMYYIHYPYQLKYGQNSNAIKAVCFTHLYGLKSEADLVMELKPDIIWGDGRFFDYSTLFKKNFSWYKGKYIESMFAPAERFKNRKCFSDRKNKAFATGTVTKCIIPEFVDHYGSECYQPLRMQILAHENELGDYIDSKIMKFEEIPLKKITSKKENLIYQLYCKLYNRTHYGKQTQYFSFDMVEMFNEYMMCIVPEDINGVPGVGFVEGMACGCAYIGYEGIDYSLYGMKPGENYITYDGTIENLKEVIGYYQNHDDELQKIAKRGYELVVNNICKDKIAKYLFDEFDDRRDENGEQ